MLKYKIPQIVTLTRNLNILAYGHNYPLHLFGVRCRRMAVSVSWFKDA